MRADVSVTRRRSHAAAALLPANNKAEDRRR
jgi:hypothetical protein